MEVAERFVAEVGMFEGVGMGDMDASSGYEVVEFVGGVRRETKELCKIQGEEVIHLLGNPVDFLYFPWGSIYNTS